MDRKYFKTQANFDRFGELAPKMQAIAQFAVDYLIGKGFHAPYYITETVTTAEEDQALARVSDTHRTRRAIDLATAGMSLDLIHDLMDALNAKYGSLGAIVHGAPVLVVYHNSGHGWHFHIQLNRSFALPEIARF